MIAFFACRVKALVLGKSTSRPPFRPRDTFNFSVEIRLLCDYNKWRIFEWTKFLKE